MNSHRPAGSPGSPGSPTLPEASNPGDRPNMEGAGSGAAKGGDAGAGARDRGIQGALILIVEDEPKLAALLQDYLGQAGYRTLHIAHGDDAVGAVRERRPALILLDLMLPGRDGIDICREVRRFSEVPIIMLTARIEEVDRLLGLQIGADDYVCKPFSPREVVARVQAILRRVHGAAGRPAPGQPAVTVDLQNHVATVHGRRLDLTPVEFRLLATLQANPGRIFSRDQLMNHLYSDYRVVTDRTVDAHIKNLRRKLDEVASGQEMIKSIYGLGYKFEE